MFLQYKLLVIALLFEVFVSLYYDRTIFYPIKHITQTSDLPVRSCENRRFP